MTTTADVVVGFLAASGVRRIYGVPGEGSSLDLMESVRARRIQFVAAQQPAVYFRMNDTGVPVQDTAANSGSLGSAGQGLYYNLGVTHPVQGGLVGSSNPLLPNLYKCSSKVPRLVLVPPTAPQNT